MIVNGSVRADVWNFRGACWILLDDFSGEPSEAKSSRFGEAKSSRFGEEKSRLEGRWSSTLMMSSSVTTKCWNSFHQKPNIRATPKCEKKLMVLAFLFTLFFNRIIGELGESEGAEGAERWVSSSRLLRFQGLEQRLGRALCPRAVGRAGQSEGNGGSTPAGQVVIWMDMYGMFRKSDLWLNNTVLKQVSETKMRQHDTDIYWSPSFYHCCKVLGRFLASIPKSKPGCWFSLGFGTLSFGLSFLVSDAVAILSWYNYISALIKSENMNAF